MLLFFFTNYCFFFSFLFPFSHNLVPSVLVCFLSFPLSVPLCFILYSSLYSLSYISFKNFLSILFFFIFLFTVLSFILCCYSFTYSYSQMNNFLIVKLNSNISSCHLVIGAIWRPRKFNNDFSK